MSPRAALLGVLLIAPLLAGCAGGSTRPLSISGVNATAEGALNLTAARGLVVTPSPENHTLVVGLAPIAQTQVFQACGAECRNLTVGAGTIIADADLVGSANLTLLARAPGADSAINFVDADGGAVHFLRWSQAQRDFQANGDVLVGGNLTSTRFLGTRTPLVFNQGTPQQQLITVSTAALEGAEVAVFARGSAQLANGSATIAIPQALQAIMGTGAITVQVTLTSDGPTLYVAEKGADHFTVRATQGAVSNATFDWFVQAPRKGAEGFVV
jgi:hypothetical protein